MKEILRIDKRDEEIRDEIVKPCETAEEVFDLMPEYGMSEPCPSIF